MSELKVCAYCGEPFEIVKSIHGMYGLFHKPKKHCIVSRSTDFYDEESAIAATRPLEDALAAENARLTNELAELREAMLKYRALFLPDGGLYTICRKDGLPFNFADQLNLECSIQAIEKLLPAA